MSNKFTFQLKRGRLGHRASPPSSASPWTSLLLWGFCRRRSVPETRCLRAVSDASGRGMPSLGPSLWRTGGAGRVTVIPTRFFLQTQASLTQHQFYACAFLRRLEGSLNVCPWSCCCKTLEVAHLSFEFTCTKQLQCHTSTLCTHNTHIKGHWHTFAASYKKTDGKVVGEPFSEEFMFCPPFIIYLKPCSYSSSVIKYAQQSGLNSTFSQRGMALTWCWRQEGRERRKSGRSTKQSGYTVDTLQLLQLQFGPIWPLLWQSLSRFQPLWETVVTRAKVHLFMGNVCFLKRGVQFENKEHLKFIE